MAPGGAKHAPANPTSSPTPSASVGGGIVIVVPTPAPVICSPSPIVVSVAQRTVVNCKAQGFEGPILFTVSDPTIARVQVAPGTYTFFYVSGLKSGTTTLFLGTGNGVMGQDAIIVP